MTDKISTTATADCNSNMSDDQQSKCDSASLYVT